MHDVWSKNPKVGFGDVNVTSEMSALYEYYLRNIKACRVTTNFEMIKITVDVNFNWTK
jgi:hypothetical protein